MKENEPLQESNIVVAGEHDNNDKKQQEHMDGDSVPDYKALYEEAQTQNAALQEYNKQLRESNLELKVDVEELRKDLKGKLEQIFSKFSA